MSGQNKLNPNQIADAVLIDMEIGPKSSFITHHDVREAARRAAELALYGAADSPADNFLRISTAEAAALLDTADAGHDVSNRKSEVVQ